MKPMEKFAFKSPQRLHSKIKSQNVVVITIVCRTTVSARPKRLLEHTLKDKRVHNTVNMKRS